MSKKLLAIRKQAEKLGLPTDITTRTLSLRLDTGGAPSTLDEKTRSVGVVCATEAPVKVIDWERWEMVDEVLLMSGASFPESGQVPLLNTHKRGDITHVLGSCRGLSVAGAELMGRAHYSEADDLSEQAWRKTSEGHLTDYSVGYRVDEVFYVPKDEKQVIDGRTFEGPIRVVTKWKVRELSTCPIGADELAKARAATADNHNHNEEENDMNKRLRKFLESRGLAQNATEEEAWRFLSTLEIRTDGKLPEGITEEDLVRTPAAAPQPARNLSEADVKRLADEQTTAEINRREEIRSMCNHFGLADMERELINSKKTIDQARAAIMAKQMEKAPATPAFRATMIADERDKFRAAGQDALILRAGLKTPENLAPGAEDLRGFSLVELGREALRMAGQPFSGSPMEMLGRALTTSDFPILLGNTANLSLMAGWENAGETWEQWADGSGSVSNFLIHTMARAGETDDLDEIGEDDEYNYGSNSEQSEQYQIATFGKLNKITRQALINDQLGAITDAFANRGEAAARKVGDVAYAVLTANSAMGDGVALFDSDHGNVGTSGVISEITMAEAVKLFGLMKDVNGKRRLNIPLKYIVGPKSIEGAAEIFFNSMQFTGGDGAEASTRANPYAGTKYGRVYDGRLDDDDTAAWYFLGPKGKTVKLFFLNGNRTPYLETKQGWTIDGVEFKTRIDVGAKAVDWRGMGKNAGG